MSVLVSVWRVATRGKHPGYEMPGRKCLFWEISGGKCLNRRTGG